MTDDLQYKQEIGRKLEDTRGTDPITNGNETFFNFGLTPTFSVKITIQ